MYTLHIAELVTAPVLAKWGDTVGKPYQNELNALDSTYQAAIRLDIAPIVRILSEVRHLPLVAIGSGGSFTAAHLAAHLHERCFGELARAATPLDAVSLTGRCRRVAVMLVTAGGSNPDIIGAFDRLAEFEPTKLFVLCGQTGSPLAARAAAHPYVDLLDFALPHGRDGFLATNSLLWFSVVLARTYRAVVGEEGVLPTNLGELIHPGLGRNAFGVWLREQCTPLWAKPTLVVLYGSQTASAAIDLESKFTEAALGVVQLADFRSFAHGRHHWLAKHEDSTAVLALTSEADAELATRTIRLLPKRVPSMALSVPNHGVATAIAAIGLSLFMAGLAGLARGIDPGRPGVPSFGRRIYHLRAFRRRPKTDKSLAPHIAAAIERKARVSIDCVREQGELPTWLHAYRSFTQKLFAAEFTGIVLDYDGTLCETRERESGLKPEVARCLARIARAGLTVGIVTGRGKSVRADLRRELPEELWPRFVIGYYNGSDIALLSDGTRPLRGACSRNLAAVAAYMECDSYIRGLCECEARPLQIQVKPNAGIHRSRLWDILHHVISANSWSVTAVCSGHSVDVLAEGVSKKAILDRLQHGDGGAVLCIGDSGRWPGNDFALLSHEFSLSSHETSPDPCTCWNLAPPGQRGVAVTLYYLGSLVPLRGKGRMALRLSGHRREAE